MLAIKVKKEYLDKDVCLKEARHILSDGKIKNMSVLQLAHEIYFHALVFYFCERTGLLGMLKKRANPIDLNDGGDLFLKRIFYSVAWMLTKRNR